jgi:hypothetical protein
MIRVTALIYGTAGLFSLIAGISYIIHQGWEEVVIGPLSLGGLLFIVGTQMAYIYWLLKKDSKEDSSCEDDGEVAKSQGS